MKKGKKVKDKVTFRCKLATGGGQSETGDPWLPALCQHPPHMPSQSDPNIALIAIGSPATG